MITVAVCNAVVTFRGTEKSSWRSTGHFKSAEMMMLGSGMSGIDEPRFSHHHAGNVMLPFINLVDMPSQSVAISPKLVCQLR
jgi:hypothetical protein